MKRIRCFKGLYAAGLFFLALVMIVDLACAQIRYLGFAVAVVPLYLIWSGRQCFAGSAWIPVLDFAVSLGVLIVVTTHLTHLLSNTVTFMLLSLGILHLPLEWVQSGLALLCVSAPLIFVKGAFQGLKKPGWLPKRPPVVPAILASLMMVFLGLHLFEPGMHLKEFRSMRQHFESGGSHPMKVGVGNHVFLGYSLTGKDALGNEAFALPYLDWLIEQVRYSKPSFIRVGVSYDAWALDHKREQDLSDQYIATIRKSGIPLFLTDTQHQLYLTGDRRLGFEEYAALQLKRTEFFLRRYQPEYYGVVTEVENYHDHNIKEDFVEDAWIHQTEKLADLVKRISPGTKTVAYIGTPTSKNRGYFKRALGIKSLDVVGLDFYTVDGMRQASELLREVHPHQAGKEFWLAETFYGLGWPCSPASKEALDLEWLKMTYAFAKFHQADAYIPWPFQYLLTYDQPLPNGTKGFSGRTALMDWFLEMVNESQKPLAPGLP